MSGPPAICHSSGAQIGTTTERAGFPSITRRTFGIGAAAAITAVVAACGGEERKAASGRTDKVIFLTAFGSQGRDSYAYIANEKGFFAEAGIEVEVQPGRAGDYNHQILSSGKAQFAVVDASGALIRYANGADSSFQILAAVQQQTLISIIAMQGGGIANPKDLEGKTLGSAPGAVPQTLFPAYARLAGIDGTKVTWQNAAPEQLNSLLIAGKIHGAGLFIVSYAGIEAAANGRKTVALAYSDYMRDLYGAVLVAPKNIINGNPDLTKRFTTALLKGLDYAVDNPEESGKILAKTVKGQDPDIAARELALMRPYVKRSTAQPVGLLEPTRVAQSVALLQSVGLIPAGSNPDLPEQIINYTFAPKAS